MSVDGLPRPDHELRDRYSVPMQPHPEKVKHKVDQQRASPGNEQVSPRLPCAKDPNADGNREPKAPAERLAYAVEDDLSRKLRIPVQGSVVRDQKAASADVADYEGGGYFERVCAPDEVEGEVEEFEEEGHEVVAGWSGPKSADHVDVLMLAEGLEGVGDGHVGRGGGDWRSAGTMRKRIQVSMT